jgi:hypothetical protein
MLPDHDPVLFRQLPIIAQIIQDETWLEGERRHAPVSSDDPVVREKVCSIVLTIGASMREQLTSQVPPQSQDQAA